MYRIEELFKKMSAKDMQITLSGFLNEDYYLKDFSKTKLLQDFLYMLELYNLVFVASNKRILLTPDGQKMLQQLTSSLI